MKKINVEFDTNAEKLREEASIMKTAAEKDSLTNLYNHNSFYERLNDRIDKIKPQEKLHLIVVDIDNFKSINDNYGHATGDYVLKTISDLMKKDIKGNGYIGRYGGEEFLIVVNSSNKEYVSVLANNIRKNIENYNFIVDSKKINVTVSIGVYNYLKDDKYFNKHIKLADEALYLAKLFGRNRVVNY